MKRKILFVLLFPFFLFGQQPQMSMQSQQDLQQIKQKIRDINKNEDYYFKILPLLKIDNEIYVSFVGKLRENIAGTSVTDDLIIGNGAGKIRSVRIKIGSLDKIENLELFEYLELAGKIRTLLDRVDFDTRADSVHLGLNLPQSYTGKNVLIGVQDWGFDYTSPMFYDTLLQNSRILAAWDQWKRSGTKPQGFNYGAEFSNWNELLQNKCDTSNQYGYATHASHVAGIAGGSGAGTIYRGMAFEAEFLFSTIILDEAAAIDSWYWMYEKAKDLNKNLIVNMSWGLYNIGTSDGTSLLSQAIEELTNEGVLFVSSAGNNGNVNFHFQREFNNDSIKSKIEFYDYALHDSMWGQSIHGWGEAGKNFEVKIEILKQGGGFLKSSPYFSTAMNNYTENYIVVNDNDTDTVWFKISTQEANPYNSKPNIRFQVKNPNKNLQIILSVRANSGNIHFWNLTGLTTGGGNWGMPFTAIGGGYITGDNQYGIGEPACADDCLTVASHAASYINNHGYLLGGGRSNFSSIGPRNDGTLKPDVSAPGANVLSSISSFTSVSYVAIESVEFQGRTYDFAKFSGTSMSSPAAAGVCALVWEANPYLSPREVKYIIVTTARQDEKTGNITEDGDLRWGFGKVDAMAAVKKAIGFVGTKEIANNEKDWNIYPNPATSTISVSGLKNLQKVQLYNMEGKAIELPHKQTTWQIENLSSGVYLFRAIANNKVYQKKIVIN